MAIFALTWSCQNSNTKYENSKNQLVFSTGINELLKDTTKVNPFVDSLRKSISNSEKTLQLEQLSDLAENWRANTFQLAKELINLGTKENDQYVLADANCKLAIYYIRKFNFDSADYYLNNASKINTTLKSDRITAQVLSWSGEMTRLSGDNQAGLALQDSAISIALKTQDLKRLAFANISKGEALRLMGDFNKAIKCYETAIEYAKQINDINKISICYNSTGDSYRTLQNFPKALEFFNNALSIAKKIGNKTQIAFSLNSMGDTYGEMKQIDKSLEYYNQAFEIAIETGNKLQECNSLSGMGVSYFSINKHDKAIESLTKAIAIAEEIGNIDKLAFCYTVLGNVYKEKNMLNQAMTSLENAIEIINKTGNKNLLTSVYNELAEIYIKQKNFSKAKETTNASLAISKENGLLNNIKESAKLLSEIYEQTNDYKQSLSMLRLFISMKDSVNNEENVKKIAAIEYSAKEESLKAEQRAKELSFKAEQEKKETELKRQKTIRYAFTIGFVLVLLLVGVVFRSLQQNKKKNKIIVAQKKEVEHQKELVEEKNKEITDSITYAKRLQDAILPPLRLVQTYFPNSFILYKPKDIIAGDFYWMEKLDETLFFAAADSTGHGVPGAMVSVVCSNALNRALKEFKLQEPGKILDKTRELVLETFEKSEGDVKDGMDISLISINTKTKTVLWSGANNPLWYISDSQIHEIKATKQPIGKTENPQPFTTHQISVSEGTIFYLITDGYADQFGGPKGKKYKYKNLQEQLLKICDKSLEEQGLYLNSEFEHWRGQLDQIDDVTIIGFKI